MQEPDAEPARENATQAVFKLPQPQFLYFAIFVREFNRSRRHWCTGARRGAGRGSDTRPRFPFLASPKRLEQVGTQYDWPDLLADVGAKEVLGRWRALPELLTALRATPQRVTEVEDPYGRGSRAFGRMARQIDAAARSIVRWEAQFRR